MEALVSLQNLKVLDQTGISYTNEGLKPLARLTNLTTLDLGSNSDLSYRGLKHLAASKTSAALLCRAALGIAD